MSPAVAEALAALRQWREAVDGDDAEQIAATVVRLMTAAEALPPPAPSRRAVAVEAATAAAMFARDAAAAHRELHRAAPGEALHAGRAAELELEAERFAEVARTVTAPAKPRAARQPTIVYVLPAAAEPWAMVGAGYAFVTDRGSCRANRAAVVALLP